MSAPAANCGAVSGFRSHPVKNWLAKPDKSR